MIYEQHKYTILHGNDLILYSNYSPSDTFAKVEDAVRAGAKTSEEVERIVGNERLVSEGTWKGMQK